MAHNLLLLTEELVLRGNKFTSTIPTELALLSSLGKHWVGSVFFVVLMYRTCSLNSIQKGVWNFGNRIYLALFPCFYVN